MIEGGGRNHKTPEVINIMGIQSCLYIISDWLIRLVSKCEGERNFGRYEIFLHQIMVEFPGFPE